MTYFLVFGVLAVVISVSAVGVERRVWVGLPTWVFGLCD